MGSEVKLEFSAGERYGFVGQNGSGKSTLLRTMANGSIPSWPRNCRALLVEQEDVGDERSSLEVVMEAHDQISLLRRKEAIFAKADSPQAASRALLEVDMMEKKEALRLADLYALRLSKERGKKADIASLEARQAYDDAVAAWEKAVSSSSDPSEETQHQVTMQLSAVREQLSFWRQMRWRARRGACLRALVSLRRTSPGRRGSYLAAGACGPLLRGRSCRSLTCCYWTSRPTTWTGQLSSGSSD